MSWTRWHMNNHLEMPSHWRLGFNIGIWGRNKHFVCSTCSIGITASLSQERCPEEITRSWRSWPCVAPTAGRRWIGVMFHVDPVSSATDTLPPHTHLQYTKTSAHAHIYTHMHTIWPAYLPLIFMLHWWFSCDMLTYSLFTKVPGVRKCFTINQL